MFRTTSLFVAAATSLLFTLPAAGGAHYGPGDLEPDTFARRSGFKGSEEQLGAAVAAAIKEASPTGQPGHDFTGREMELGMAVETLIKALNNRTPYQHEPNDALIKSTMTSIQFAKNTGTLEEKINHDVLTQSPMILRVGKMIEKTGNTELAMLALTERTACFYQLVLDYRREGDAMVWKSPYGNVLDKSSKLGQHDFSEQWIHENYTIPMMTRQAALMNMEAQISPWQDDGWITMRLVPMQPMAAN
jgi:hypothetical protein